MDFSKVEHIFFDLDHTLWDYDLNSKIALTRLFEVYSLQSLGIYPLEKFISSFHKANLVVWDLFEESSLNRDQLRNKRMELVFEDFDLDTQVLEGFHEDYYLMCSQSPHLIHGAIELLETLNKNYSLHIITNGFDDAQFNKLKNSGLKPYFKTVTTSEMAKSKKPEKAYFEYALNQANASPENSLVIGDGWRTDVAGAISYGLKVIWFNQHGKPGPDPKILQINHLPEIITLISSFGGNL